MSSKDINVEATNETTDVKVTIKKENKIEEDTAFKALNENKVEKSNRNNVELKNALERAKKGDFDEDIEDAKGMDLLKVNEKFTIREIFSLEKGETYYKLYKEVFYICDPHKYYYETVEPTVFRRISAQHEEGDEKWAKAVAEEMNLEIIKKA